MPRTSRSPGASPQDYVAELVADWRAERPDLPVDPVAIVYRVGRLAAHLAAEIDKTFVGSGLSNADFSVLANLRRSGAPFRLTQRRLMDALGLTSGTISARVDRLSRRGLVVRDLDPADGRGVLVTLTAEGERLFEAVAPKHLANEARLVAALFPEEQAELARLLQVLLVEYESSVDDRPDERLGMVLAPAHVGQERRTAVGLQPAPGLLVESVTTDGPAAKAGIQAGDLIVAAGAQDLRSLTGLAAAHAGAKEVLVLRLVRGSQTRQARVRLSDGALGRRRDPQEPE
jgi:DNA-binding MarR family transcriptional regulator